MLEKTEGKMKRGQQRMRQLNSITGAMEVQLCELQETEEIGRPSMLRYMSLIATCGCNCGSGEQEPSTSSVAREHRLTWLPLYNNMSCLNSVLSAHTATTIISQVKPSAG